MRTRIKWSLIGIPDHQGVLNVGGRIGAAQGPKVFQKLFSRFKGRDGVHESRLESVELENLSSDVAENHLAASKLIQQCHKNGASISVVVGGGHDHGYSHLLGIAQAFTHGKKKKLRLGCINIDAHLDVREPTPMITSGSPFFLALESGILSPDRFIEFGIQKHCNAPDLWTYVDKKCVQVVPFEKLRHGRAVREFKKALKKVSDRSDFVVISFDIDSVASAFAPGVSAPQAEGFNPSEILEMMTLAGLNRKTVSLGIFETNPEHDIDDRTSRLAATAAYHFIASAIKRGAAFF